MLKKNSRRILLLLPFILILLIDIFYTTYNYGTFIVSTTKTMLLSTVFMYCLFSIFIFITKSLKKSNIVLLCFFFIFLILNQIKIFYMQEPIYLSDIYHLFNASGLIDITNGTLIQVLKKILIPLFIQFIVFGVILIILSKCNSYILPKRNVWFLIIPMILLGVGFCPSKLVNSFMLSNIFDNEKVDDYNYSVDDVGYYAIKGVIAGMYGQFLENQVFKPDNYNEEEIDSILKEKNSEITSEASVKPNIILFVSESFWDVEQLSEIQFDKEVTSNFKQIAQNKNSKFFNMISPTYGGISANVGWSLLAGANPSFYSKAYIPYLRLYDDDNYYKKLSIVKELKQNGYITKAFSADNPNLYNCDKVYNYMGFDQIKYFDKVEPKFKKGYFVSDEYITTNLIEDLNDNKDDTKPSFHFVFTMQAHMPYMLNKYSKYDIKIKNSNLNKENNDVLLSYAQGIYDADKQLKRLYDFIMEYEKPTILVFLGDHLPYLSTVKGNNVIDELDFFNTEDDKLNLYRKYNTQALIASNYDIEHDSLEYLGPDLLMSYVSEKADIHLSSYYKYLNTSREILPTFNRFISIDKFGNIEYTNQVSEKLLNVYNLRNDLQYKLFFE